MKDILSAIFIGLLIIALGMGLGYVGYLSYSFYAPKYEEVRRQTFEQSRAFNEGMVRDLENLKMQYMAADDAQKIGLRATIIHRFEVYPIDSMTPDLQLFYQQLVKG